MSSTTTNLGLYKPSDGDGNLNNQNWTDELNANFDTLDARLYSNVGIRYVKGDGDNSNDGYTPGTAMKDVVTAYDSLPSFGGEIRLIGTATNVYWDSVNTDRGLWLVGPNDPDYNAGALTAPLIAAGFRVLSNKSLRLVGWGSNAGWSSDGTGMSEPVTNVSGGSATDPLKPSLWITGTNKPIHVERVRCVNKANPVKLGLAAGDGTTNTNTARIKFKGCFFSTGEDDIYASTNEAVVLAGYVFWLWFEGCCLQAGIPSPTVSSVALSSGTTYTYTIANDHGLATGDWVDITGCTPSGYNGNYEVASVPTAATFTIDIGTNPAALSVSGICHQLISKRRCAARFQSDTLESNANLIKFSDCTFVSGGVRYEPSTSTGFGSFVMEFITMEGNFIVLDQPPAFHLVPLPSGDVYRVSSTGGIRLQNVDGADGDWPLGLIRTVDAVDGTYYVTVISSGHTEDGGVVGPHVNINSVVGAASSGPLIGLPFSIDRRIHGLANKNWAGSPAHARYVNLAQQNAASWSTAFGSTTVTPGIADPYGGTNAATLSAAGDGGSYAYVATRSVAAGDWIIGGCWARVTTSTLTTPWRIELGGGLSFEGAGTSRAPSAWGTNDWRWNTVAGKVVSSASADVIFLMRCDASTTPSFAYPLLIHLPVADGWTESEVWHYLDGLETYSNSLAKGEAGTLYGHVFNMIGGAAIGDGGTISKVLTASTTYDPANMAADGDATGTTLTVTGAAVGDPCFAGLTTLTTQQVLVTAHVTATNTVRVDLLNKSGGALDLASGTLKVTVFQNA